MTLLDQFIGMPPEMAAEILKDRDVKLKDISSPDKYHANTASSLRIVRAADVNGIIELYVAGFKDDV